MQRGFDGLVQAASRIAQFTRCSTPAPPLTALRSADVFGFAHGHRRIASVSFA